VPIPKPVTRVNRSLLNPLMGLLAGNGPFVVIEHVGRRSGRTYRTPLMAFRHGATVTIALTYGRDIDWLKNITAAKHCRMLIGHEVLRLGAPVDVPPQVGRQNVSQPFRSMLRVIRCNDFIELPVLGS
jgi:deazaflavin-dependent oxidoreductase (nitroreductase family)